MRPLRLICPDKDSHRTRCSSLLYLQPFTSAQPARPRRNGRSNFLHGPPTSSSRPASLSRLQARRGTPHFLMRRRARQDAARRICDGRNVGGEPRFWGFGGLKPLLMVPGRQSECGGSSDSPRARLLFAPPHGILGAHLGSTEFTPNAGRPTPGRTLASPSLPPRRLPGGPGAAPDGGSDLVMPRLPVSTRST